MAGATSPIGILAGGGGLPLEIARCIAARGGTVQIVALDSEADADFSPFPVTRVNWGQVGAMVKTLKAAGCNDLVIVGKVKRPDPRNVRPDAGFFLGVAHILKVLASGGDDGVLRAVLKFFETKGLRVIGAGEAAPDLVIGVGVLGGQTPSQAALRDIDFGFKAIELLGPYDVGQGVVVKDGILEAVEAAEGTDAMLDRVAKMRSTNGRRGGVLVKRPKPGQELRVDMPVIGPETVHRAAEAGLDGIALLAGKALAAERQTLIERANERGVFVYGATASFETIAPAVRPPRTVNLTAIGSASPHRKSAADAEAASGVLSSLAPLNSGRAVVVARRYVLAVEAGEGVASMLQRAAGLRQWGDARARRRNGLVALARSSDLTGDVVEAAAEAGLRGIVVLDAAGLSGISAREIEAANRLNLFVARCQT